MKEFTTAVEDIEAENEREEQIVALMQGTKGKGDTWLREPMSREDAEKEVDSDPYTEFKLDDRVLKAYQPTPGQLTLLLATMGRGQSQDMRFASIINIMLSSLDEDDQDYFESRLITRDKKRGIPMKKVEEIFEYLMEE